VAFGLLADVSGSCLLVQSAINMEPMNGQGFGHAALTWLHPSFCIL